MLTKFDNYLNWNNSHFDVLIMLITRTFIQLDQLTGTLWNQLKYGKHLVFNIKMNHEMYKKHTCFWIWTHTICSLVDRVNVPFIYFQWQILRHPSSCSKHLIHTWFQFSCFHPWFHSKVTGESNHNTSIKVSRL